MVTICSTHKLIILLQKTGDDWMYRDYQKVSLITTSIERRVRYALKVVDEAIRQVTLKTII